jgi:pyridoxamine 5'-phosphate oxidase-like protein
VSEPRVGRPQTEPGYGIPESLNGTLDWGWARDRLVEAAVYWVASVRPNGRPHVTPIWGVWVDDAFWMEGGARTRRFRNLAENPAVVVSVERADDVVIMEGDAERMFDLDAGLTERLVAGYSKYKSTHGYEADPANWAGGGIWRVMPNKVFGWSSYPRDATRWTFGGALSAVRS